MALALLTLLTGLSISAVAIYYSVLGLANIFAAAAQPIIIMGTILEISKLVTASWLKQNWARSPILLRSYLLAAVAVLMMITSMGIFGFLSKAHSDQNLVSGDVTAKIAVYDEKIKISKENIDANRRALKQMDEAVDQVMGRSTDEKGADKAVAIRRAQQKERVRLQSEIAAEQKTISRLNEERAPIAAEVRKVEAEVGPLKYIAAFIYGDNTDANVLEKAVTWLIIIIVAVFDPLAVLLLLASQMSFQWARQHQIKEMRDEYDFSDAERGPVVEAESKSVDAAVESEIVEELASAPEVRQIPEAMNVEQIDSSKTLEEQAIITTPITEAAQGKKDTKVKKSKKKEDTYIEDEKKLPEATSQELDINSRLDSLIESGNSLELENVYKKIVRELGKTKRSKTTHWGPIKTNTNKTDGN